MKSYYHLTKEQALEDPRTVWGNYLVEFTHDFPELPTLYQRQALTPLYEGAPPIIGRESTIMIDRVLYKSKVIAELR